METILQLTLMEPTPHLNAQDLGASATVQAQPVSLIQLVPAVPVTVQVFTAIATAQAILA